MNKNNVFCKILIVVFCVGILSSISIILKKERELRFVYSKCSLIKEGMTIYEFYEEIDHIGKPKLTIQLGRDSIYRHYIIYPPRIGDELPLKIEYDNHTKKILHLQDWRCND